MIEKVTRSYVANDGTVFYNKSDCLKYEKQKENESKNFLFSFYDEFGRALEISADAIQFSAYFIYIPNYKALHQFKNFLNTIIFNQDCFNKNCFISIGLYCYDYKGYFYRYEKDRIDSAQKILKEVNKND